MTVPQDRSRPGRAAQALLSLALLAAAGGAWSLDEAAAEALMRRNNCLKCHGVDKAKDGPSFRETANKYRGKPDAVPRVVRHLTSGETVKFPDGHEEAHKIVRAAQRADVENLAAWILAQ